MSEEQLARLHAMIEPDQQTWDLSPNDVAAIKAVLNCHYELRAACEAAEDVMYDRIDKDGYTDDGPYVHPLAPARKQLLAAIAKAKGIEP